VVLAVGIAALGCGSEQPYPLRYASELELSASPRLPVGDTTAVGAVGAADRSTIDELHAATVRVVSTPRFAALVADVDAVLARASADPISGRRLAALYLGFAADTASARVCYRVQSGGGSETAETALGTCNGAPGAITTLRSVTLERARSTTLELKACAINTLAHEWSHAITVTSPTTGHGQIFEDNRHDHQKGPVAAYVIGAVAQCDFLSTDRNFDVRACIEAVGTNAFDPASCHAGWSDTFVRKGP
jgi:hypothetical protein